MQYFCTYIVAKIRILINMAYHVGMDYTPFRFFCAEKSVIMLRHSSLVAKTPAWFTCSLVNALTTAHSRYHLFCEKCLRHKWFKTDYAPFRFFYAEKSVITLRHSSLVAKTPAWFTCSLVNALTTAHSRYHLFARSACGTNGSKRTLIRSDFCLQKI